MLGRFILMFVVTTMFGQIGNFALGQTDFLDPVRLEFEEHNVALADWRPMVSSDGLELYFTNDFQIWRSERGSVNESWGAVEVVPELDSARMEDGLTLSHDGLTAIFGSDRDGGEGGWDLWQSTRTSVSAAWEPPVNLGPPINTRLSEGNASLSADGKSLYFASDGIGGSRRGGVGRSDIWISQRNGVQEPWGEPVNLSEGLGPEVNTRLDEFYPSISPDDLHLYFTSTRFGGHGLEDVWAASRSSKDEPFGTPVNLGPMINTPQLDGTGTIGNDGALYLTRGVTRGQTPWELWVAEPANPKPIALLPGDADQNQSFDQLDLVQVQVAAKYLTGLPATWGEGDWDGWDSLGGGTPGSPSAGDGFFNVLDVVAALAPGHYLSGPYASMSTATTRLDDNIALVYDPATGGLAIDVPIEMELTSISINSASSIFTGDAADHLVGAFDVDSDSEIFKATFGGSFGSLNYGTVAQEGLSREFLLKDLTIARSLAGGRALNEIDLIYIPEPSSFSLFILGIFAISATSPVWLRSLPADSTAIK